MKKKGFVYDLVIGVLRVGLVVALVAAGWNIYERLPAGPSPEKEEAAAGVTELQIVLRPSPRDNGAAVSIPVQLYPIDVSAAQREYGFEPRPGVRFEEFLKERMQGRSPVRAHLDERGQAVVMLTPGRWWVHALLSGAQNVEWRLPVNVAGRQQTVELNTGNIYARTKSF
ncbi:MAG TPA: hypothetical protein VGC87_15915 [Pyrinomonadaceae bacterium]